jgi:hypothetical protein
MSVGNKRLWPIPRGAGRTDQGLAVAPKPRDCPPTFGTGRSVRSIDHRGTDRTALPGIAGWFPGGTVGVRTIGCFGRRWIVSLAGRASRCLRPRASIRLIGRASRYLSPRAGIRLAGRARSCVLLGGVIAIGLAGERIQRGFPYHRRPFAASVHNRLGGSPSVPSPLHRFPALGLWGRATQFRVWCG